MNIPWPFIADYFSPRNVFKSSAVKIFFLGIILCASAFATPAAPVLPHIFSDHMVLQRDMPISIWGWADPGERIEVALAGISAQAVTGADGHWEITLPVMPAGGPFNLTVRGKTAITLRDVMIGEVWVASGQSNMTFALSGSQDAESELAQADNPNLRLFTVPGKIAVEPQKDTLPGSWQICTPEAAKSFSAVAFVFARNLQEKLQVPVGIIESAWPGTQAQEWTDSASLASSPILEPILDRWKATSAAIKSFAHEGAPIHLEFDDFELIPKQQNAEPEILSNFDDGLALTETGGDWSFNWTDVPNSSLDLVSPGRGGKGYAIRVAGVLDGLSYPRLTASLKADSAPADLSGYAAIHFWVRGSGSFQFQMLQPDIIDTDNYGAGTMYASSEWKPISIELAKLRQAGWGVYHPFSPGKLTGFTIVGLPALDDPPRPPSGLYDGMIVPLERYRIRGVIWYQGESDTWEAYQYRTLLPAMIRGWRKAWNEPGFPFLIVQLPNQGTSPEFAPSIWAELREAQLLTLKSVPDTGLAVTIDVGEANNLHPPRKKEVGDRLALWALGTTYGEKMIYSGPIYEGMKIEGSEIRIRFSHTDSGLMAKGGGPLTAFTIAGEDRKFHHATARIDGDTIVVSSPDVPSPVSVRYAWSDSPDCNLYNKEGLPASPFRTDDWPGASFNKR